MGLTSVAVVFLAYKLGNCLGWNNIFPDQKISPEKTIKKELQMSSYDKERDSSGVMYFLHTDGRNR